MLGSLKTLETLEPGNGQYYQVHYRILTELGAGDDDDIRDLLNAWYKGCQDEQESLVILSMVALDQGHPDQRNPAIALAAAKRAYSLGGPSKPQAGLHLAETYKGIGRIDLALSTLEEVIKTADAEQVDMVKAYEGFYRRLEELGKNPDAEYTP